MEAFFLGLFLFGALFTVASIALGFVHALPGHDGAHVGHLGHGHDMGPVGHGHDIGPVGHGHELAHAGHAHDIGDAQHGLLALFGAPILNASSLIGFVTWFGAGGYLLTRLTEWAPLAILIGATLGGTAGAYVIARFLGFVLAGERVMDPDDYRLEGTIGQVSIGIPPGGTGEVIFSKAGARRSEAARAVGDAAIPRGTEVVITRYERGFATVQSWADFLAARDKDTSAAQEGA
jgi:hypothetical protein